MLDRSPVDLCRDHSCACSCRARVLPEAGIVGNRKRVLLDLTQGLCPPAVCGTGDGLNNRIFISRSSVTHLMPGRQHHKISTLKFSVQDDVGK